MKFRIKPANPKRRYECFNCERELTIRNTLRRCPFCNSEKSFHEMD